MPERHATLQGKVISLIDRRAYWRDRFSLALRGIGADVETSSRYTYQKYPLRSDLVVLLCTAVTPTELALVQKLAIQEMHILVLADSLSPQAMRALFRAGAVDVTEMPVHRREFVDLVERVVRLADGVRKQQTAALAGLS